MNLEAIKELAFEHLGNKRSHPWKERGNKYYHGERVAKLAIKLRKYIIPEDDGHDDILTVAAWFHDIMNGAENHAIEGASKTRKLLNGYCSPYEIDEICKIISVHDDRHSDRSLFSDYIKLHQDADHLDHIGTFDIWLRFIYAAYRDESIDEIIKWCQTASRGDFEWTREELNYEISKKIYDEKIEFIRNFCKRMIVEFDGGIWREAEFLK